jgi:tetraacyldisaccharide 4'-kinase
MQKLLLPISWIWGWVASIRHFLYDHGLFRIHRVDVPVISVGNIAVGGTGKTPLVIELAKYFRGKRIAILSRGYGGGDETKVMRRQLPDARFYENPNRVEAAMLAAKEGAELILLDDGFQHRRLHRDVDVVIVRSRDRIDSYLPAGRLRDHPRRAEGALVIDGYETRASCPVDLSGVKVGVFCGIAHPERFKKTVVGLGAEIVSTLFLGDHEAIGKDRLMLFYLKCKSLGAKYLICTEKDEVKLEPSKVPVYAVRIEPIGLENLMAKIEQKLYH